MKLFFKNGLIVLLLLVLASHSSVFGQVNDITGQLQKNKRDKQNSGIGSSGGYYYAGSGLNTGFLLFDLFRITAVGMYRLQKSVLATRHDHPEIVSLEGFLQGGCLGEYNGVLLNPQIRANWGAFSTEFRQQSISDNTGLLSTMDWQVVKMNIPIYPVIVNFGMGFSKVLDHDQMFVEYSIGGKVRFLQERASAEVAYRSTDGSRDFCFRKEAKVTFDYEVKSVQIRNRASIRISPTLGYMYQNYYGSFQQQFLLGGLTIRYF